MASEIPKHKDKRRMWLLLMILPFVGLVALAVLQAIVRFLLAPRIDKPGTYAQGPGDITQMISNMVSLTVGLVCVTLIILFPLWLILFLRDSGARRTKTTAILLAIFFGFWTWFYTYDQDRTKFWINLTLSIVTFGYWSIIAWIWAVIDRASKPDGFYGIQAAEQQPAAPSPEVPGTPDAEVRE